MTGSQVTLLAAPGDPATASLAMLLRAQGGDVMVAAAGTSALGSSQVWFADQVTFLVAAQRTGAEGCNLLLRPGLDEGRTVQAIPLAIKLAIQMFGDRARFWAVNEASAQAVSVEHGVEVRVLLVGDVPRPDAPPLDLSLVREGVRVPSSSDRVVPLPQANLVRLAARWGLSVVDGAGHEAEGLIALAHAAARQIPPCSRRVLFVLPGGSGLGHMSRALAIADRLSDFECEFLVHNDAAYLAVDAGYRTYHRQSAHQLEADSDTWRDWEAAALSAYLTNENPAAVIVDASHIDPFIVKALASPGAEGTSLIWVRREMWRPERQARWALNGFHADLVIVPGELAANNPSDREDEYAQNVRIVEPVIYDGPDQPLSARQARRALSLGRGRRCLVMLGAWQPDRFRDTILAAAKKHRVRISWAQSPLAARTDERDLQNTSIALYPMVRHIAAFDGVISAAGYNSFHELMLRFDGPVLFLPVDQPGLDDQAARAQFAQNSGFADLGDAEQAAEAINRFFEGFGGKSSQTRPEATGTGAMTAAKLIRQQLDGKCEDADG